MLNQTIAIIPAFNEEEPLPRVVRGLLDRGVARVRVVDNGSTDRTAEVAREAGAEVVHEPRRGYGQACFTGFKDLTTNEAEWILFCDADGCDDLDALPDYLAAAREGADLVIGNRRAYPEGRAAMTPVQNFGNWLATTLLRLIYGKTTRDLGPMRLVRLDALHQLDMRDRDFGWTVEMQARAFEENLDVRDVPVRYFKRQAGVSKISGTIRGSFLAGAIILSTIGLLAWRRLPVWLGLNASRASAESSPDASPSGAAAEPLASASLAAPAPLSVQHWWLCAVAGILVVLGAVVMAPHGNFFDPSVRGGFFGGAAIMGLGFVAAWWVHRVPLVWFWLVAILARVILLPMTAGDDIWRYLWEGSIQWHGFNPYLLPPVAPELTALRDANWAQINHPTVTAVYPPIAQITFALMAAISSTVLGFKVLFVLAELAMVALLLARFGTRNTVLVAWNPLLIYCFAGGAHYDSLFLLPLVAAWLLAERGASVRWAAVLVGVSVGIKWLSAPLLLFLCWRQLRRDNLRGAVLVGLCGLAPIALGLLWFAHALPGFRFIPWEFYRRATSCELFDRSWFESFAPAWLVSWVFIVALATAVVVAVLVSRNFGRFAERWFFLFLIFTPSLHVWYFTWVIPWAAASRNVAALAISLSGFVYFAVPLRYYQGEAWRLTSTEWLLMWLPFVGGVVYEVGRRARTDRADAT